MDVGERFKIAYEAGDGILRNTTFVAVVLAMISVVGGFAVTNRMLNMIAGKKKGCLIGDK